MLPFLISRFGPRQASGPELGFMREGLGNTSDLLGKLFGRSEDQGAGPFGSGHKPLLLLLLNQIDYRKQVLRKTGWFHKNMIFPLYFNIKISW